MPISSERIKLALEEITFEKGFLFEQFANKFLASEFPNLRPIGGMHDEGRDAYLYQSGSQEDVFVQISVTPGWKRKITDTITALKKNGHQVREIIYSTNQDLSKEVSEIKSYFRKLGVSIDVRDINYFVTFSNASAESIGICEELAKKIVDPLFSDKGIIDSNITPSLTDQDQKLAVTFFELSLATTQDGKNLTRLSLESLVTFVLRDSSPENLVPRQEILKKVKSLCPTANNEQLSAQINGILDRFVSRDIIKHHEKVDSFTLSHSRREELKSNLQKLLVEQHDLQKGIQDIIEKTGKDLEIDFDLPIAELGEDVFLIIDQLIMQRGKVASLALLGKYSFHSNKQPIVEMVASELRKNKRKFKASKSLSSENILDILPESVLNVLRSPNKNIQKRIKDSADAYCLLFSLKETNDIQDALNKIFSGCKVLVDTNIIIPCMAEKLYPKELQHYTNVLRAAKKIGVKFFVGDDVINELQTHLDRNESTYFHHGERQQTTMGASRAKNLHSTLISSYFDSMNKGYFSGTFTDFLKQFRGQRNPNLDLIEYLKEDLGIDFENLSKDFDEISHADQGTLISEWTEAKPKKQWMDAGSFDILVYHDARAFLLIKHLRAREAGGGSFGEKIWWLTLDGIAFRFDKQKNRHASICMSPEFFSRYISILPKKEMQENQQVIFPIFVEASKLGFIPAELRPQAEEIYSSMQGQKEYLIRRRLRDFVNQAIAEAKKEEGQENPED